MKIFVGADHRGFQLKKKVDVFLKALGHEVVDVGTHAEGVDCDYPLISYKVGTQVVRNPGSRGILLCMTGLGHSIAANKVPGIRAANVTTEYEAQMSREHNDANVLALGARILDEAGATKIVDRWLQTAFAGGRHQQRVDKIAGIERAEAAK